MRTAKRNATGIPHKPRPPNRAPEARHLELAAAHELERHDRGALLGEQLGRRRHRTRADAADVGVVAAAVVTV